MAAGRGTMALCARFPFYPNLLADPHCIPSDATVDVSVFLPFEISQGPSLDERFGFEPGEIERMVARDLTFFGAEPVGRKQCE